MLQKRVLYFLNLKNASKTCFFHVVNLKMLQKRAFDFKHKKETTLKNRVFYFVNMKTLQKRVFFHFVNMQTLQERVFSFCKLEKRFKNVLFHFLKVKTQ